MESSGSIERENKQEGLEEEEEDEKRTMEDRKVLMKGIYPQVI